MSFRPPRAVVAWAIPADWRAAVAVLHVAQHCQSALAAPDALVQHQDVFRYSTARFLG